MHGDWYSSEEAVDAWRRGAESRNHALRDATDRMMQAAAVGPGCRVLDLGTGTGDTSVLACRLVLPEGEVLATDISDQMLDGAIEGARIAGVSNLRTLCADTAALDVEPRSFDSAIARHSLQFVDDVAAALQRIHGALRPGGRLAALVWSSIQDNAYLALPIAAAQHLELLRVPIESVMGPFALGDAAADLRHLRAAEFEETRVERIGVDRAQPSVEAAVDRHRDGAIFRTLVTGLTDPEAELLVAEITRRTQTFAVNGGVRGPGVLLLLSGTRNRG